MKGYEQNEFIEKFNNYFILFYILKEQIIRILENLTDSLRKIIVKERKILNK